MNKPILFLSLIVSLVMALTVTAADIIWVDENEGNGSSFAEWQVLLESAGHTLTQRSDMMELNDDKIAALNSVDLVIISRDTNSGDYIQDSEVAQWNGITAPLMQLSSFLVRNNRWQWLDTTGLPNANAGASIEIVEDHAVFSGVGTVGDEIEMVTTQGRMTGAANGGNGQVLATQTTGLVWIVLWEAGVPFYSGTTEQPAATRMWFAAGGNNPEGTMNLTEEGQTIFLNAVNFLSANPFRSFNPSPTDGVDDVPYVGSELSWSAGKNAQTHDVYLGTVFDDVNDATINNPMGVLVSPGQETLSYPLGTLDFGTTYYWRVDEQRAGGLAKGEVWSFVVEPYAIPVAVDAISVTASSDDDAAIKTIDGSGLIDGGHDTNTENMWLSGGEAGAWLEYSFDKAYKLDEMLVWNHNSQLELAFGLGAKDVVVSYSADGVSWGPVTAVSQFARATGQEGYQANTSVPFGGQRVVAVRIEIANSWGGAALVGLSEVKFMVIPESARTPIPTMGAVDVDPRDALSWRVGRSAALHRVYVSTDRQAVVDGAVTPIETSENSLVVDALDLGMHYFWRVDEVNDVEVWVGDVWDFNTVSSLMVDDFESYTDNEPNRIFDTWIDGWEIDDNGAQVGHWDPPYAEQILALDNQSMPLYYVNNDTATISEGTRTFTSPMDWTVHGVDTLIVNYQGIAPVGSVTEEEGVYTLTAAGGAIWNEADYCQYAYAPLNGDCTIIARVDSLEAEDGWSKAGVMIRDSLDAGSAHAMAAVTGSNGVTFGRRLATDGDSSSNTSNGRFAPYWVKLERSGSTFTASMSVDGSTWESLADPLSIVMTGEDYVGLVLASNRGRDQALATAVYSNVTVTPGVMLDGVAEISPEAFNKPAPLYVVIGDAHNRQVTVTLDEMGTTATGWNEGKVNLLDLSGSLNLRRIESLTIGVGDGAAGSSGIVYIDNVELVTD